MADTRNFIVVTNGEECVRWLRTAADHDCKFIFVEDYNLGKILQLVDAVNINGVLLHLRSQDVSASVTLAPSLAQEVSFVEELAGAKPGLPLLALAESSSEQFLLTILRAGIRDFIRIGSQPNELLAVLGRYSHVGYVKNDANPNSRDEPSQITAVINARQGNDSVMLSLHLAQAIQERQRTLLIDLGMPHADSLLLMNLTAKYNFIDVMRNISRLDTTLIDTGFVKHKSGLTVLSMPEATDDDVQISPAEIYTVLRTLRKYFPQIVINVGGVNRVDFLQLILSAVDRTLIVGEQTVPSCKRNFEMLKALRDQKVALPNPGIVLDHYLSKVAPDADSIAKSFDLPVVCTLPPAGLVRLDSMNTGESILVQNPRHLYAVRVRELARIVLGEWGSEQTEQGFSTKVQRFFAELNFIKS